MIDFFARQPHYIDHMLPIWLQLGERAGSFLVPTTLKDYLISKGGVPTVLKPNMQNKPMNVSPIGDNPILTAGYSDLQTCIMLNQKRPAIFMEHGVGLVFPGNASYAGNGGFRKKVALTLAPNQNIYEKAKKTIPDLRQEIIGTPKLDRWWGYNFSPGKPKPVVAIAFHWDASSVAPEAGTAFRHYQNSLSALGREGSFKVIGHGHPRAADRYKAVFEKAKIEWVGDFDKVVERADVYVNDCSSTMYEFLVSGKPVVIMNAPWFRRNIDFGIRFWQYTDIGMHVEDPKSLIPTILETLKNPNRDRRNREKAVTDLYPFFGMSAKRTATLLEEYEILHDARV